MNRRNFIKSTVVASIAFPYIGIGESNLKRSENSLFTIGELRTWCEMNGFHYIEDAPFCRYIDGVELKLCQLPFLYHTDFPYDIEFCFNKRYEYLRYRVIDLHTIYKHFYLYDIENTSTVNQKENGNCSADFLYCGVNYNNITYKLKQERLKNCSNVYCIKDECWYKPIIVDCNLDSGLKYSWVDRYEKQYNK